MKRLITAILLIMVTLAVCIIVSGCSLFGGEEVIKNSKDAKDYLKTKYGEDFIELREPIFTPGSNKFEYFFSDCNAPCVSFNVYEENGKFTDNYEIKKNSFYLVDSSLRTELEMYEINSMIDSNVYDDKSECFCYLVIEESSMVHNTNLSKAKECIQEFGHRNKMAMTVALFSLNEQDFAVLLSEFSKSHSLNSTIVEKYHSCVHYSFVLDSEGNVCRDELE